MNALHLQASKHKYPESTEDENLACPNQTKLRNHIFTIPRIWYWIIKRWTRIFLDAISFWKNDLCQFIFRRFLRLKKKHKLKVCMCKSKPKVSKGSPASPSPSLHLCAHTKPSLLAPLYGPLQMCSHQPWGLCLHLITVLITDDLSLIEWVCSCTINLKAQWTVRGQHQNKTTLFRVQREQALSVWHPSWTILKGQSSPKSEKLCYCK